MEWSLWNKDPVGVTAHLMSHGMMMGRNDARVLKLKPKNIDIRIDVYLLGIELMQDVVAGCQLVAALKHRAKRNACCYVRWITNISSAPRRESGLLQNKILRHGIVCHDAGAANMLLSYISEQENIELCGYFEGPAKRIQNEYLPHIRCMDNLNEVIQTSEVIITGTGWQSNLEFEARQLAASLKKYSIAVVDHWTNYQQRFCRDGKTILPNEIWVFDKPALERAEKLFPSVKLNLMHPSYEKRILAKVGMFRPVANRLLYLCEPIRIRIGMKARWKLRL